MPQGSALELMFEDSNFSIYFVKKMNEGIFKRYTAKGCYYRLKISLQDKAFYHR